jgi:hypothetical protein
VTRVGSRAGAAAGSAVLGLGLPLVSAAGDLPFFVAALFVLGVGNGLLDVSMNAHAARVERAYGRPIFAGFHAFWNIGGLAGSGIAAVAAARLIRLAAVLAVAGFALVIGVPDPAAVLAGFGVIGLGVAAIVPLAWSAAGRRQPGAPGRAIAGVSTLGYLGFLLGPVLIGGLAGLAGLRLALIAAAALTGAVYFLAPALAWPPVSPRAGARRARMNAAQNSRGQRRTRATALAGIVPGRGPRGLLP